MQTLDSHAGPVASSPALPRELIHPRDALMQTMQRIYQYRMTTTSGGNLSLRDVHGDIWITPARVDKGNLQRDDMIRVDAQGEAHGPHPPSSEYPFHRAIYDARPDLGAIVHAHPVALVAFSITKRAPDTRLFAKSWHTCGEPGFAPYALPGSAALGQVIAETFAKGHDAVILENHGVVVGGKTLADAFARFETFEFTAKTLIKAGHLGPVTTLTDKQIALRDQGPPPLPAFSPGPADVAEKDARRCIVDFCRRGYRQRLLISTEGSLSTRLGPDRFVITPSNADRLSLSVQDPVLIDGGRAEAGKTPSRAARLHAAIYAAHPEINAVINANSVNATAFAVCGSPLDSRTIPESYVFLREVQRVSYETATTDAEAVAQTVGPTRPVALLENDGVLACGKDVLSAFDCLEVLESTAEALINSRPLGEVSPMGAGPIRELEAAFFG
ncbi:MAG: class II aldolase/adducin family protein [Planctomycetota bacterium]